MYPCAAMDATITGSIEDLQITNCSGYHKTLVSTCAYFGNLEPQMSIEMTVRIMHRMYTYHVWMDGYLNTPPWPERLFDRSKATRSSNMTSSKSCDAAELNLAAAEDKLTQKAHSRTANIR